MNESTSPNVDGYRRPRILILTPRFPYPVIGGDRQRIFRLCKALATHYDVDLLSLCESAAERDFEIPNDGVFKTVRRVLLPRWRSWLNCGLAVFSRMPLQVAYYRSADFRNAAHRMIEGCDAVIGHLIRTADVAASLDRVRVLEMTDAISLTYERSRQHFNPLSLRSVVHFVEARRVARYERAAMSKFDLCVFVSDVDRRFLLANAEQEAAASTMVCTMGVDAALAARSYAPDGKTIIFIGNMTSYQNADAVDHFLRDIFPRVLDVRPDARLRIVGRIDAKLKAHLSSRRAVDVTGEVPDVGLAAKGASIGVCPVRIGAGVQTKLLEYMALGLPAVTSPVGLEGIDATPDVDLLVAQSPNEFAQRVCDVLSDAGLASRLSISARNFVGSRHSWDATFVPLIGFLDERLRR
jgi:glycosyltransferase involved in cell wall biosynthesis